MKWFQTNAICLFAVGWLAASTPSDSQISKDSYPPPEITLNGLTSIFDDKSALFKTRSPDGSDSQQSYFLAEGQRAGGIELLSVDMKAGKIKVDNHGVVQTISLCQPPDLSTLAATSANGGNNSVGPQNSEINSSGSATLPRTQIALPAGQYSGAEYIGSGANGLPDAASANDAAGTNPSAKKGGYSLVAARQFEQMRLQTAAAVYDGTAEPIPLTPLTPPGTPAALIGPDRAWFPD